jgi:hypothetical protein
MHKVTNETETTQKLRVNHPAGGFTTAYLKPGESGHFDIDPRQSAVSRGLLKATEVRERAEKPAKAKALSKKAAPKPPRRKTAPAAHAEVAEAPLIAGRSLSDTDSDANG